MYSLPRSFALLKQNHGTPAGAGAGAGAAGAGAGAADPAAVIAPEYAVSAKTKMTMQNPDEINTDAGHAAQEYHVTDANGEPQPNLAWCWSGA